eukprot:1241922-Rhodomonas_salina.1
MGKEENGGVMRSIDVRESHMKPARRSEEGGASLCKACAAAAVRAQSEEAGAQTEENEAQTSLSFNPTAIITFLTRMTSPQTKNAIHPGFLEEVPHASSPRLFAAPPRCASSLLSRSLTHTLSLLRVLLPLRCCPARCCFLLPPSLPRPASLSLSGARC